jgi:hypothetical protein
MLDGPMPSPKKLDVNKDQAHCLSKGPIYSEELVVNPKNKGVRWTVVWLVSDKDGKTSPPVPARLKAAKGKVEVDQPCCKFIPHVAVMREGQTLVFKNSGKVAHNTNIQGGTEGPNTNPILPVGKDLELTKVVARLFPINVSCSIHPWMKAYVFVFDHPYFAVTDKDGKFEIKNAPAGKYRLVVWQESVGWVVGGKSPEKGGGQTISIKSAGVTTVKPIKLKPED